MRKSILNSKYVKLTEKYNLIGKIGEGTYGVVYKAEKYPFNDTFYEPITYINTNNNSKEESTKEKEYYAIKYVKPLKEGEYNIILSLATIRELKILKELHHDNIITLYDQYINPRDQELALVFDYAHYDLRDIIIQSRQHPLSECTRKSLMYQILKGIDYLHSSYILHRDLKPQNILIIGPKGKLKIADFGLARFYNEPLRILSDVDRIVVTLWYRAPELLFGCKHYTTAIDMWSVGCIFVEIINTSELFNGKEDDSNIDVFQKDQCDKIFKILGISNLLNWKKIAELPEYNNIINMINERKYPDNSELKNSLIRFPAGKRGLFLYDLISKLLEYDPEKRITAKDALLHPYFTKNEPFPQEYAFDEASGTTLELFKVHQIEPISDELSKEQQEIQSKLKKKRIIKRKESPKKIQRVHHPSNTLRTNNANRIPPLPIPPPPPLPPPPPPPDQRLHKRDRI